MKQIRFDFSKKKSRSSSSSRHRRIPEPTIITCLSRLYDMYYPECLTRFLDILVMNEKFPSIDVRSEPDDDEQKWGATNSYLFF